MNKIYINRPPAFIAGILIVLTVVWATYFTFTVMDLLSPDFSTPMAYSYRQFLYGYSVDGLLNIIIAVCLYMSLKCVDKRLAAFGMVSRVVYGFIVIFAALNFVGSPSMAKYTVIRFNQVMTAGYVVLAVHLVIVGLLIFKTRASKTVWVGFFILGAGVLTYVLLPPVIPLALGELILAGWLLYKSINN